MLQGSAQGKLFIEMSTVGRTCRSGLARRWAGKAGPFIECPVRHHRTAKEGKLFGSPAAMPQTWRTLKPLSTPDGAARQHVGPVGAGAAFHSSPSTWPLLVTGKPWESFIFQ